jgi:glycosyltransferase involved in cell wall biosynthesis
MEPGNALTVRDDGPTTAKVTFPIAYIAGQFPARSETFVYREVRGLRALGWDVRTVSLNEPRERGLADFADLEAGTVYVYGPGRGATIAAALAEALAHPIRSTGTMLRAIGDAIRPHDPMSPGIRAKVVPQAFASLGLARRLRRDGVRHLHCHFAHAPTTVGMYAARQLRVPFSFTGHANDLFQRRALIAEKLQRAAFVACISEWHRELYRSTVAKGDERYHVIRCGVDVDSWTPKPDAGREIATSEPVRVLTVGRLVEKKGVDTLIRGLAEFGKRTSRLWHLTVAGDGPERRSLEGLAAELQCANCISFLGAVDNDRVRGLLAQADLFALPCREDRSGDRDGIPVVLMEAMACGVPVISGDLPAIRELVRPNETGVLVDGTKPEHLAAEVDRLVTSPETREILARNAREHVAREFSMTSNLQRLIQQMLSSRNSAPHSAAVADLTPTSQAAKTPLSGAIQDR